MEEGLENLSHQSTKQNNFKVEIHRMKTLLERRGLEGFANGALTYTLIAVLNSTNLPVAGRGSLTSHIIARVC